MPSTANGNRVRQLLLDAIRDASRKGAVSFSPEAGPEAGTYRVFSGKLWMAPFLTPFLTASGQREPMGGSSAPER